MKELRKIIINEISSLLDEDYGSIKEIEDFSYYLLKYVLEKNIPDILEFMEFNNSNFSSDYLFHKEYLNVVYQKSGKNYKKLDSFLKNTRIVFSIDNDAEKEYGQRGSYSYSPGDKTTNKRSSDHAISIQLSEENMQKISKQINYILNDDLSKDKAGDILMYCLILLKDNSLSYLIHEMQHAYDDFRSNEHMLNSKQMLDFQSKYQSENKERENQDKKQEFNPEKYKDYLRLVPEIWARFAQAMTTIQFTDVEFDFNENANLTYVHKMKPLNGVLVKFFNFFPGWRELFDTDTPDEKTSLSKIQLRLVKAVVQFWHNEQDRINKLNAEEQKRKKQLTTEQILRKAIRKTLTESFAKKVFGDYVEIGNETLSMNDDDAIPFFYYDSKFYVGAPQESHWEIFNSEEDLYKIKTELEKEYLQDTENYDESDASQEAEREMMDYTKYNGRIWYKRKVIVFWKYPDENTLVDIVKDLNSKTKVAHIDGSWKLALPNGSISSLKDYTFGEISAEEHKAQLDKWRKHIINPMLKTKMGLDKSPQGVGSKHKNYNWNREIDRIYKRAQ